MTEKYGIENLKKCIALGVEGGNVLDKVLHGSGIGKWGALMDLLDEVVAMGSVDWSLLDDEWKDLSNAERDELKTFVAGKYDVVDNKAEAVVEKAFSLVLKLDALARDAVELVEELKS